MNIEKEFYTRIKEEFAECSSLAYHLAEGGALMPSDMERYLIIKEFKEMVNSQPKKTKTLIREELSEKYCKSVQAIRSIVER